MLLISLKKIFEFSFLVLLMGTRASADEFSKIQLGILPRYFCKLHSFHPLGIEQKQFLHQRNMSYIEDDISMRLHLKTLRHLKDSLL